MKYSGMIQTRAHVMGRVYRIQTIEVNGNVVTIQEPDGSVPVGVFCTRIKLTGRIQMKLMTKALLKKLPAIYSTEKTPQEEKIAVIKFFFPMGRGTWYGIEYNPEEKLFFGYVVSPLGADCDELGYFSLTELESVRVRGLRVERDLYFKPTKLSELMKERKAYEEASAQCFAKDGS